MHVLPGLAVGGTEMVLLRLVGSTSGIKHRVVTLTVHDALRPEFEQLGVQVYTLGMSRNPFSWIRVFKLRKIIREFAPDILQSWLYAADLALMFSGVGRSTRKIWNIRQSETGLIRGQLHIYLMQRLAALLSRVVPDQIVYCGAVAKFLHQGIGYGSTAAAVIPNGIDVARYKPDVLARKSVREELGLGEGVFVFGMVGRYDPLKNQQLLLNAYALLAPQTEHVSLIMAGTNVDGDNPEITAFINQTSPGNRVQLLGSRTDIPRVLAALDCHVLTSSSEGWPNVLAEAMASELYCITTPVGDAPNILDGCGKVLDGFESEELAAAMINALEMTTDARKRFARKARVRIESEFSMAKFSQRYQRLYEEQRL